MNESQPTLRPIIVRPSLIYDMSRPAALPSVGAFALANKIGLPFVDRPVAVHALASAMVRAMGRPSVKGVQRYPDIDRLSAKWMKRRPCSTKHLVHTERSIDIKHNGQSLLFVKTESYCLEHIPLQPYES